MAWHRHTILLLAMLVATCLGVEIDAQNFASPVIWQRVFGGAQLDGLDASYSVMCAKRFSSAPENLLVGLSKSGISGDKTQANHGGTDIWAIRYDDAGNLLWDKSYGGNNGEEFAGFVMHSSGDCFYVGASNSTPSGDKTAINHPAVWLQRDIWIVKTDALGNVLWDRIYGGDRHESAFQAIETSDGGILVVGMTESNLAFDISTPGYGSLDGWVFKIDANGNLLWEHRLGGDGVDYFLSVVELSDQSIFISGLTSSNASGDVSSAGQGGADFWLLRLSAGGSTIWDKRFGSTVEDTPLCSALAHNGDVLVGGYSEGGADGTKTQPLRGFFDYWLIQVDAAGNQVWDKTYGGLDGDMLNSILPTCDGNYLLGGNSSSGAGFDKTEPSKGNKDYWMLKVDIDGDILWDLDLGGLQSDFPAPAIQLPNGQYIFSGTSNSGISGDKTLPSKGNFDYWILDIGVKAGFSMANDSLCEGQPLVITDESTRITERWEWDFGDPASGAANTSTLQHPTHTYAVPGSYTVTQIVFEGCQVPDTLRKTVTVLPAQTAFTIPNTEVCEGAAIAIGSPAQPGVSYQWTPAVGLDNAQSANPIFAADLSRTYTLTTSNGFCSDAAIVEIAVARASAGGDLEACAGDFVALEGTATPGMNIQWSPAGLLSNPSSLNPGYQVLQDQVFTMTASLGACIIQDQVSVSISPDPSAAFSISHPLPLEDELVEFAVQGNGIVQVEWHFGDGFVAQGEPVQHAFSQAGAYPVQLLVRNAAGCASTSMQEVIVGLKGRLFVPTAFTPNGDGLNDVFEVSHTGLADFQIMIFDRNGRLVFQSGDPSFRWDGSFSGRPMQEGAYAYRLLASTLDGEKLERSGSLALIR